MQVRIRIVDITGPPPLLKFSFLQDGLRGLVPLAARVHRS
jgi:hypothetical protein